MVKTCPHCSGLLILEKLEPDYVSISGCIHCGHLIRHELDRLFKLERNWFVEVFKDDFKKIYDEQELIHHELGNWG